MHKTAPTLLLSLISAATGATASLPITDRTLGTVPHRPYCPSQPASADFQRTAFYEFINEFFEENKQVSALSDFVSAEYIQHNPYILSGRSAAIAALGDGKFFGAANFTFYHVMFDSPFAMIHYKVEQKGVPFTAYADFFRFNGTCIEEHWDVIQSLPGNATNPLALF